MMNLIRNLKIRNKVLLIVALPLAGFLYFSGNAVIEKVKLANEMKKVEHLANLSIAVNGPIHELQIERGASSVYLGSQGKKMAEELSLRKSSTDRKVDKLKSFLEGFDAGENLKLNNLIDKATSKLDLLS